MTSMNRALAAILFLAGCATPRPPELIGASFPTAQHISRSVRDHRGSRFLWGGTILAIENRADSTVLEILAFPLDGAARPEVAEPPQGRFLAEQPGFLEPREYAPERLVTVSGRLRDVQEGRIGEQAYRFPYLDTETLVLWPKSRTGSATYPDVRVGVGVGSHGGGVGVRLGF